MPTVIRDREGISAVMVGECSC